MRELAGWRKRRLPQRSITPPGDGHHQLQQREDQVEADEYAENDGHRRFRLPDHPVGQRGGNDDAQNLLARAQQSGCRRGSPVWAHGSVANPRVSHQI